MGKLSQMLPKIRAAVSLGKLNSQMLTKVEKFHELLKSTFADVCDVPGISGNLLFLCACGEIKSLVSGLCV